MVISLVDRHVVVQINFMDFHSLIIEYNNENFEENLNPLFKIHTGQIILITSLINSLEILLNITIVCKINLHLIE